MSPRPARRFIAGWLTILVILPFTAPFSVCDASMLFFGRPDARRHTVRVSPASPGMPAHAILGRRGARRTGDPLMPGHAPVHADSAAPPVPALARAAGSIKHRMVSMPGQSPQLGVRRHRRMMNDQARPPFDLPISSSVLRV